MDHSSGWRWDVGPVVLLVKSVWLDIILLDSIREDSIWEDFIRGCLFRHFVLLLGWVAIVIEVKWSSW